MAWDYEAYITEKLNYIKSFLGYDIDLEISNEQAFAKIKTFKPNTIYVVIKYLSSEYSYSLLSQPIQILAISEQNQIDMTRTIFENFTSQNNWKTAYDYEYTNNIITNVTMVKQQYNTPVVLSNFNEVGFGYRSVVYTTGTLQIMENINDIYGKVTIDGTGYDTIACSIAYQMSGNTQAVGSSRIAITEKSMATITITLTVPLLNNTFCNKCLDIAFGNTNGNSTFTFSIAFYSGKTLALDFKLTSCQIVTAPNQAPSLQLGFMR